MVRDLPVGLVHPHVLASFLHLGPELELAVSSSGIHIGPLVQRVPEFAGPLKKHKRPVPGITN